MSRFCAVARKRFFVGNNVSHANNKTKRRFHINLRSYSLWSEILKRTVSIKLCVRGVRTLEKRGGFDQIIGTIDNAYLNPYLRQVKREICIAQHAAKR